MGPVEDNRHSDLRQTDCQPSCLRAGDYRSCGVRLRLSYHHSMGRTRPKTRKARLLATELTDPPQGNKSEPTVDALLEKARELIIQCDYGLAGKFVERVLQRAPDNAEAKEILGVVQLETGLLEKAKQVSLHVTRIRVDVQFSPIRHSYHCSHHTQAHHPHHPRQRIYISPS